MTGKLEKGSPQEGMGDGRPGAIALLVDRAEVLEATVLQLRKDLDLSPEELPVPPLGEKTFEVLRTAILASLIVKGDRSMPQLLYRVDLPEAHAQRTLGSGGLHALAGEVVLRCLQKVLTRMRYAGRI